MFSHWPQVDCLVVSLPSFGLTVCLSVWLAHKAWIAELSWTELACPKGKSTRNALHRHLKLVRSVRSAFFFNVWTFYYTQQQHEQSRRTLIGKGKWGSWKRGEGYGQRCLSYDTNKSLQLLSEWRQLPSPGSWRRHQTPPTPMPHRTFNVSDGNGATR